MNFRFYTGSERIAVLEDLRKPSIIFPPTWEVSRSRQRESAYTFILTSFVLTILPPLRLVITWLLQHEPDKRPTAFELSNSSLLPTRLEDEYYKNALRLMGKARCWLPLDFITYTFIYYRFSEDRFKVP